MTEFAEMIQKRMLKVSNQSALVASRMTQALRSGWAPNKIMAALGDVDAEAKDWAKQILDVCLAEQKNWPQ